jgi:hypothetical protein
LAEYTANRHDQTHYESDYARCAFKTVQIYCPVMGDNCSPRPDLIVDLLHARRGRTHLRLKYYQTSDVRDCIAHLHDINPCQKQMADDFVDVCLRLTARQAEQSKYDDSSLDHLEIEEIERRVANEHRDEDGDDDDYRYL